MLSNVENPVHLCNPRISCICEIPVKIDGVLRNLVRVQRMSSFLMKDVVCACLAKHLKINLWSSKSCSKWGCGHRRRVLRPVKARGRGDAHVELRIQRCWIDHLGCPRIIPCLNHNTLQSSPYLPTCTSKSFWVQFWGVFKCNILSARFWPNFQSTYSL